MNSEIRGAIHALETAVCESERLRADQERAEIRVYELRAALLKLIGADA